MELTHPQLRNLVNQLADFMRGVLNPKLPGRVVILYGRNGCGKTHAAKCIARLFQDCRMKIGPVFYAGDSETESTVKIADCLYRHWPAVVDGIKKDQWLVFEQMMAEYLTILDDIGAEHDPSGIGLEKLYLILSRREKMNTLITTNFSPEQWAGKFEKRIASRLFRNTIHVDLSAVPDFNT